MTTARKAMLQEDCRGPLARDIEQCSGHRRDHKVRTFTGTRLAAVVPFPSCPEPLDPQQWTYRP
jgi:hypothetical protein